MIIETAELLALLHVPADTPVDVEQLSMYPSLAERVTIGAGDDRKAVVVRSNMDPELAQNHAAITDVMTSVFSGPVPRVYALQERVTVEEDVPGVTTLALQLPPAAVMMAVDTIARLHTLPVREGLRQGQPPESVIQGDLQLFRLGFTSTEREAAAPHLQKARELLLEHSPFGFVHGECTADRVLIGADLAWLVDFSNGGHGCQLYDLAAFLVTSGEPAEGREQLAMRYTALRKLPEHVAGLVELAELLWGLEWQLGLSRRLVLAYEDETVSAALALMAARIDRAMRDGWGAHPVAAEIRRALWPSRRAEA